MLRDFHMYVVYRYTNVYPYNMHEYVCMHICMDVYRHVCMCANMLISMYECRFICRQTYMCVCVAYVFMVECRHTLHTYIDIYVCMYVHIYVGGLYICNTRRTFNDTVAFLRSRWWLRGIKWPFSAGVIVLASTSYHNGSSVNGTVVFPRSRPSFRGVIWYLGAGAGHSIMLPVSVACGASTMGLSLKKSSDAFVWSF